jgi:hypothetical protein
LPAIGNTKLNRVLNPLLYLLHILTI